jgi:hypothetical protein
MADPSDPSPEPTPPKGAGPVAGAPRWVKVLAVIALVLVVLFVLAQLTGIGGPHGPGRHLSLGAAVAPPSAPAVATALADPGFGPAPVAGPAR